MNYKIFKLKYLVFALALFLLLYNFISFIRQNAVDMPYWDEWDVADIILSKDNWREAILMQHNEHRIGTGLTLMKIMAPFTNWSQFVEIALVSLEILTSCFLVLYVKKKITGEGTLFDLAIPLIFLNILQWGNILFAFQVTFVFPLLFLCLGIWALTVEDTARRNVLLVIFSLLGAFSSFHGLFIPVIFIVFLAGEAWIRRFKAWRVSLLTILAEILIIALYFWGYERKLQATINLKPDFLTLDFFSTVIANGFFFHADISKYFGLGYLLTVITVLFLIWGIYQIMTSKNQKKLVFWVGIIFIGYMLLFALSITIGRFTFGLGQASETRYITFSMLAPLGIYFILESFNKRNIFRIILILILLGGLFSYPGYINDSIEVSSKARAEAAQCYQKKEQKEYPFCYEIAQLYPDETRINSFMPKVLEYKKKEK